VPSSRIVASRRGEIVLLRPSDGSEICVLVTIEQARDTITTLSLAPDGATVFFAESGFARCGRLFGVEIPTGRVRLVVDGGYAPVVSPDGRYLAYNASFSCGDRRHRLVVRDFATGNEREWVGTWPGGYGDEVTWGLERHQLIVTKEGTDSATYFLFDTRTNGSLEGVQWPSNRDRAGFKLGGRPLSDPGVTLGAATVRSKTKTVLFSVWYSTEEPGQKHPILEFDPRSHTFRTFIDDAGGPLDFDPSGSSLLYRGSGSVLFRYRAGRSVRLGRGYYDAAW
jgi:hypothetical protein